MKLLSAATAWFSTPGPIVAIEVAADRVNGVMIGGGREMPELVGHASEPLPPGAIVPTVAASNLEDRPAAVAALRAVLDRLPGRHVRVGLVVPDSAAKVSLVRFESVPTRDGDLEQMIRWQVRKAVPFKLDEAQIAYTPGSHLEGGGREFVVVVMRRDIVEEYESLCVDAGLRPGVVDVATFGLINTGLRWQAVSPDKDWLIVHAAAGYNSVGIVRGDDLVFFRNRAGKSEGDLSDLVHQTVMYYEDRLGGGGITRVLLARSGDAQGTDLIARALSSRLAAPVDIVNPRVGMGSKVDRTAVPSLAAPIGLLLREHAAAA